MNARMRKPIAGKKREGFSLTEVVVSIMILTIGLLAAGSTLVAVFNSREYSKSLMASTNLAEKTMEELKAAGYRDISAKTETFGQIPGYEQCRRVITVTPNADDTLKQVVVEVVSRKGQSIKLETLVSKR
jgi:prepilin-type N-terminal cleavage/methylation domain-containing protein